LLNPFPPRRLQHNSIRVNPECTEIMKLTDTAIRFHTTVAVLTVILTLGGIYSYVTIPKEAAPSIEIPNIIVTTIYPGASPDDIETLITQHIEREIHGLNGIKEIRSTSTEGVSQIVVEF